MTHRLTLVLPLWTECHHLNNVVLNLLSDDFLKLNYFESELLLRSLPHEAIHHYNKISSNRHINDSKTLYLLISYQQMHMTAVVILLYSSWYLYVLNNSKIRLYLRRKASEKVSIAFITSRLDRLSSPLISYSYYFFQRS